MRTDTDTTDAYTANGYKSRADYLAELCTEYPADVVHTLADLLGPSEDFDGLVTMLEDYQEDDENDGDGARSTRAIASAIFPSTDAAAVRTARENLTGAYLEADAALNAARAGYAAALKEFTAADAALNASRDALNAASDADDAASAALKAAD